MTAPTAPVTVEAEVLSALRVLYRRAAAEWAEDDPALRLAAAALARADGRPATRRRRQLADVLTTLTLELEDVEIEGWATKVPAVTSGPVEMCHPDESEAEVTRATWRGHDITGLVSDHYSEEAEEALLEALDEYEPDYEEDDR